MGELKTLKFPFEMNWPLWSIKGKENRSDSTYCKLLSLGKLVHAWMWNALFETVESAATKIAFKQNRSQKKRQFSGFMRECVYRPFLSVCM